MGPTSGLFDTATVTVSQLTGVTQDSTSGIYVPASAAEWTTVMAAAGISSGNPDSLYLFQEASGDPADSIGTRTLTAVANAGSPTYQQAVTGWTRTAIAWADNTTAYLAPGGAGTIDTGTTSCTLLMYLAVPSAAPASDRTVVYLGGNLKHKRTSALYEYSVNSTAAGVEAHGATVHPVLVKYDRTNSAAGVFTDLEKIVPTFASLANNLLIGGVVGASSNMKLLYGAVWLAGKAEISNANIKTLLQTLGWTVGWTP